VWKGRDISGGGGKKMGKVIASESINSPCIFRSIKRYDKKRWFLKRFQERRGFEKRLTHHFTIKDKKFKAKETMAE